MAVSPFKTFAGGEILTASDLNSSFSQVFDNGQALGWPATEAKAFADNEIQRANLKDYGEITNAIGATGGGTQDIDITLGNSVTATVDTSANTFTFSNPTASDDLCSFTLFLTNGGSQTVTWPASVTWAGVAAPSLAVSGVDILRFRTVDGGTIWYGSIVADVETAVAGQRKNRIINGDFDFWERAVTLSVAGYLADRFTTGLTGSTTVTTQQAFTLGQTDVPFEPTFYHRNVITSSAGAGNGANLQQRIEGVRSLAGQTATLSFWAKADSTKNIATEFEQNFGTGGSPSSGVTAIGVTTHALTTSWQKFTVTAAITSISGKTLGSNGNDFLEVLFWFDAGSDFNARTNTLGQQSGTFDIAQVQIETGSIATSFEETPIGEVQALCQRYYWKGGILNSKAFWSCNAALAGLVVETMGLPVTMRTTPSASTVTAPSFTNCSTLSLAPTKDSLTVQVTTAAAGRYRTENGLYDLDAEL